MMTALVDYRHERQGGHLPEYVGELCICRFGEAVHLEWKDIDWDEGVAWLYFKIENDLNAIVPKGRRTLAAHLLIFHGRRICTARKPACPTWPVEPLGPKVGVSPV